MVLQVHFIYVKIARCLVAEWVWCGRRLHVCTARTCVRGVLRDVHVRVRGTFFVDANLPSTDVLFGSRESVRVRGIGC